MKARPESFTVTGHALHLEASTQVGPWWWLARAPAPGAAVIEVEDIRLQLAEAEKRTLETIAQRDAAIALLERLLSLPRPRIRGWIWPELVAFADEVTEFLEEVRI